MADEYKSVLSGGLSLKGGLFKSKKRGKKSKRKREDAQAESRGKGSALHNENTFGSGEDEAESNKADVSERDSRWTNGGDKDGEVKGVDDMLTPAQRRFREKQLAREGKKIRTMVEKTHRERVEEFNALLASMTEHNDIPRCSAAGNG